MFRMQGNGVWLGGGVQLQLERNTAGSRSWRLLRNSARQEELQLPQH